jgi:hypothetical protein
MEEDEDQTAYDEVKFMYDEDNFDLFFPPRSDAIFKLVRSSVIDDDPDYYAYDHVFICIDAFSLPAALEQTKAVGMTPSESAISFLDSINSVISILRKLNLTFNLHGSIITYDSPKDDISDYPYDDLDSWISEDIYATIPGYDWTNLGIIIQERDDLSCPAE